MAEKTTNINIRVDKNLKKQADELFKSLGLNTSTALNIFLTQCVRNQAIPFNVSMNSPVPSDDLMSAIKEVEYIENGKKKVKGYHNVDEMFAEINEEIEDYE